MSDSALMIRRRMIVDFILIALIVLSAAGLFVVVGRKSAIISSVDVRAIPAQKAGALKSQIIEERFARGFREVWQWLRRALRPVQKLAAARYQRMIGHLKELEERYSLPLDQGRTSEASGAKIAQLLNEARACLEDGLLGEAEKRCLEAISLNQYEASAYRLLADVYFAQKEYAQAKEVFEFVLKLNAEDAEAHQGLGRIAAGKGEYHEAEAEFQKSLALADQAAVHLNLAEVYRALGESEKALIATRDALAIEPRNPKILDRFCSLALECGQREYAKDAFVRLKEVNPENQKLADFSQRLEQLSRKR